MIIAHPQYCCAIANDCGFRIPLPWGRGTVEVDPSIFKAYPVTVTHTGPWYDPKPHRGRYQALVHAEPVNPSYTLDPVPPSDFATLPLLICVSAGYTGKVDKVFYPESMGSGAYEFRFHYWSVASVDGRPAVRMLDISCNRFLGRSRHRCRLQSVVYYTEGRSSETNPRYCWPAYWSAGNVVEFLSPEDGPDTPSHAIGEFEALASKYPPGALRELGMREKTQWDVDTSHVAQWLASVVRGALYFDDLALADPHSDITRSYAWQNYEFQSLRAQAYIEALNDLPRLSDNMLQNLQSCFTGLFSFAFKPEETMAAFDRLCEREQPDAFERWKAHAEACARKRKKNRWKKFSPGCEGTVVLPDLPKEFSDTWLSYRYEFSTSVMDGQQAWDYFFDWSQRLMGTRSDEWKCCSQPHSPRLTLADGTEVTCVCTFTMRERYLTGLTKALEKSYELGIEPNAYVAWDFIPFSFVVDWFLPIGDALDAYTKASHFVPEFWEYVPEYEGYSFVYSLRYTRPSQIGPIKVYTRWYESSPPHVEPEFWLHHDPSFKPDVWLKRGIDGVALLHGAERSIV